MTFSRFVAVVVFFFLLSPQHAAARTCFVPGTSLVFGNGVWNTHAQALDSLDYLRSIADWEELFEPEKRKVNFGLAYNSGEGAIADLAEFSQQKGIELGTFWGYILDGITNNKKITDFVNKSNREFLARGGKILPDVREHANLYAEQFRVGNRIVLVSHSQGNMFANMSFSTLFTELGPISNSFGNVQVATPAQNVEAGGPHVTLHHDLVILPVLNRLPTNHSGSGAKYTTKNDLSGHSFVAAYLTDPKIQTWLRYNIQKEAKRIKYPTQEELNALASTNPGDHGALRATVDKVGGISLRKVKCYSYTPTIDGRAIIGKVWSCQWSDSGTLGADESLSITFKQEDEPMAGDVFNGFDAQILYSKRQCEMDYHNLMHPERTQVRIKEWDPKNNKDEIEFESLLTNGEFNMNNLEFLSLIHGKATNTLN